MQKEFYVISPDTSLMEQAVFVEEEAVAGLYPGKILIEINQSLGAPRAFPGSLWHGGFFWHKITGESRNINAITHLQFRDLFTDAESMQIDNFMLDTNLPPDIKMRLNSIAKTVDAAQFIDLADSKLAAGLAFMVSIGYLAPERVAQILAAVIPSE